jgi:hypothetical protein
LQAFGCLFIAIEALFGQLFSKKYKKTRCQLCVLSFIFYNFAEFLNVHTKVGNFEIYDIPLKELSEGTHEYEFLLDDKFFEELEGP